MYYILGEHAKRNDRYIFQFKLVPKANILRYRYYRNPRCYKFTERIRQKKNDSIENSIQSSNSVSKKNLNLRPQERLQKR